MRSWKFVSLGLTPHDQLDKLQVAKESTYTDHVCVFVYRSLTPAVFVSTAVDHAFEYL